MSGAALERWQLEQLQSLPLSAKVWRSTMKIQEWYGRYGGEVYVAFSGGKDSTVLLHLVRSIYPDVPAVFCDTGLEYPEIRNFVKTIDNVVWVRPKMTFGQVIKEYGYPVVSKSVSSKIKRLQRPQTEKNANLRRYILEGVRSDGTRSPSPLARLANKWRFLIDAPFKVSDVCCDIMKKRPSHAYAKETGRFVMTGEMASDGFARAASYCAVGCNAFDIKRPKSTPLGFWVEDDVWEYLRSNDVPYSSIYDMGEERTGCMFCMFGLHMEKGANRFDRMKESHPAQYRYCMDKLGLRKVLDYMGDAHKEPEDQTTMFE